MKTFRGADLRDAAGWVIVRLWDGRGEPYWEPLRFTIAGTRSAAIRKYDEMWSGKPNAYRRERRRGEVLAVHCLIEPITFGGAP